jgi:uncharacterized membrane protein
MSAYSMTVLMHSSLGAAALLTYWIAALAKKGSGPHKLAGKVYVAVMVGLLVPAVPLSINVFRHFSTSFGAFLFYLLVITGTALWQGWYATRNKRDFSRYTGPGFRRLAWLNIGSGLAVLGLGIATSSPIFLGFSLVGLLGGRSMLRLAKAGPAHPRWWMEQHLGAMLGCGVATHIAFLQIGLPRLLPSLAGPLLQNIAWLGPLVVAGLARVWLGRKYLGGMGGAGSPNRAVPADKTRAITPRAGLSETSSAN